jgi:hypothetical protein
MMIIFEAWLLEFNEKIKKENRHVLLLIDDAGGHNISLDSRFILIYCSIQDS